MNELTLRRSCKIKPVKLYNLYILWKYSMSLVQWYKGYEGKLWSGDLARKYNVPWNTLEIESKNNFAAITETWYREVVSLFN